MEDLFVFEIILTLITFNNLKYIEAELIKKIRMKFIIANIFKIFQK